jgi:hypothetical protein
VTSGTTFKDTGLAASTLYSYTVTAFDVAGNESGPSGSAQTSTLGSGGGGGTFTPVQDSYVNAGSPSTNYGLSTGLRVDSSPLTMSYLRFAVSGLSGSASSVVLKVWATSSLAAGFDVYSVADDSWGETTITSVNAPAVGSKLASSGPVSAGGYVSITLPASAVSGNGDVNFALVPVSSTALALSSRESSNKPQLVVS